MEGKKCNTKYHINHNTVSSPAVLGFSNPRKQEIKNYPLTSLHLHLKIKPNKFQHTR